METLLRILDGICPEEHLTEESDLTDSRLLESLNMVTLITDINHAFDISIPAEEIVPENFCSVRAIYDMIERIDEA